MLTPKPKRPAVIVREDETAKYVQEENGNITILVKGSMNGTPYPVGTKGTLQYIMSSSFGLDFFEADKSEAK